MEAMEALLQIEAELGRNRKQEYRSKVLQRQSYANRVVDLDILLYGEHLVVTAHLQVPHPMLLERDFALQPMAEAMGISVEQAVELVTKIVKDEI
jgi:2-amino-4-hydroxy-6-hydroxymethyldihydropteridine diphosphokinase